MIHTIPATRWWFRKVGWGCGSSTGSLSADATEQPLISPGNTGMASDPGPACSGARLPQYGTALGVHVDSCLRHLRRLKWLTWWRAQSRIAHRSWRSFAYLFAWPGMDADTFLDQGEPVLPPAPSHEFLSMQFIFRTPIGPKEPLSSWGMRFLPCCFLFSLRAILGCLFGRYG